MLDKAVINSNLVKYQYEDQNVLINTSNGQWWVFDKVDDFENCILEINDRQGVRYELLKSNGFFQQLEEYRNPSLQFHLTSNCNLRCKHCYMHCEKEQKDELTYLEIINVLDDFRKCGGQQVVFTGGEVVLKNHFFEIVKHSKSIGLYVVIITNGTLWTNEMIDEIKGFVDQIQISLDGYDEQSNSQIRGLGVFDKALKCADAMLNRGIEVIVAFTPMYGYNKEKYIEFGNLLVEKYAEQKLFLDIAPWIHNGRDVEANVEKNEKYYRDSIDVFEAIFPGYELSLFSDLYSSPIQNCGYGKIVLDSNGDFAFCSCLKEIPKIGNVRTVEMEKIFELAAIAGENTCVTKIKPCNNCDFKYICGGSCRMVNFKNSDKITDVYNIPDIIKYTPCTDEKFEHFLKMMVQAHKKRGI